MTFVTKDWEPEPNLEGVLEGRVAPTSTTPISAAALEDMEGRLAQYTDDQVVNVANTSVIATAALTNSPSAGATTFTANATVPPGSSVAIEAFSTDCEIRRITNVSGSTVTIDRDLDNSHSAGAKVIYFQGAYAATWFGVKADGTTDDSAALQAAFDAPEVGSGLQPVGFSGGVCQLPWGIIRTGSMLHVRRMVHIQGMGGADAPGTLIRPDAGVVGMTVESYPTNDPTIPAGTADYASGHGAILSDFKLFPASKSGTAHGIVVEAKCTIRDVTVHSCSGDGIHIDAGVPKNANLWRMDNVLLLSCDGAGLYVHGNDGNAGTATAVSALFNDIGIQDKSFLGNTYVGCECEGNDTRNYDIGEAGDVNASQLYGCYSESGSALVDFYGNYVTKWGGVGGGISTDSTGISLTMDNGQGLGLRASGAVTGYNDKHAKLPFMSVGNRSATTGVAAIFGSKTDGTEYEVIYEDYGADQFAFVNDYGGSAVAFTLTGSGHATPGRLRFPSGPIFTPVTAASQPNNCLFVDTADGKLKFKDGSGVVNALY